MIYYPSDCFPFKHTPTIQKSITNTVTTTITKIISKHVSPFAFSSCAPCCKSELFMMAVTRPTQQVCGSLLSGKIDCRTNVRTFPGHRVSQENAMKIAKCPQWKWLICIGFCDRDFLDVRFRVFFVCFWKMILFFGFVLQMRRMGASRQRWKT